jgi:hypothetical protein
MIRGTVRLAARAALFAAAVAAGRQHERTCAFGTHYWRATAELALHLYDEPRLREIQAKQLTYAGQHRFEELVSRSVRLITPKTP